MAQGTPRRSVRPSGLRPGSLAAGMGALAVLATAREVPGLGVVGQVDHHLATSVMERRVGGWTLANRMATIGPCGAQ